MAKLLTSTELAAIKERLAAATAEAYPTWKVDMERLIEANSVLEHEARLIPAVNQLIVESKNEAVRQNYLLMAEIEKLKQGANNVKER